MWIWETFDYNELMLMVGWEFGWASTSMSHKAEGRMLVPCKERFMPRKLASRDVIQLRVSSYSGSKSAKNDERGYHLYFHSSVLPIHIAIHPTDTKNNFHLTFSDSEDKSAYHAQGGLPITDFLVEDKLLRTTPTLRIDPKAARIIDTHLVPFVAKLTGKGHLTKAHVESFLSQFVSMMNVFHKNRRIQPRKDFRHSSILDLPYYPATIKAYIRDVVEHQKLGK